MGLETEPDGNLVFNFLPIQKMSNPSKLQSKLSLISSLFVECIGDSSFFFYFISFEILLVSDCVSWFEIDSKIEGLNLIVFSDKNVIVLSDKNLIGNIQFVLISSLL